MPTLPSLPSLHRARYRAQQFVLLWHSAALQGAARRLTRRRVADAPAAAIELVRQRYRELLDRDLDNAERGLYPRSLLFQFPVREYARAFPALLRDAPRTYRRMRAGNWRDLPRDVDADRYPPYYRRNFHWQTDGYLSRRSARLYDLGVELLFHGTADVMRRQVIPHVTRFARAQPAGTRLRLLDVACGTGRTLVQLLAALPDLHAYGLDLSPYYVELARHRLAGARDCALMVENAEHMPLRDGSVDVVTSVFLFHELPAPARRRVLAECLRVLRPGGLLVLEDSAQPAESGALAPFLEQFQADFHEPFYRDYLRDDLAALLGEIGFAVDAVEPHLVAKVVAARKPG